MDMEAVLSRSCGCVRALRQALRLLQVLFRPTHVQEFSDTVQLVCEGGTINVPIKAQLPLAALQVWVRPGRDSVFSVASDNQSSLLTGRRCLSASISVWCLLGK